MASPATTHHFSRLDHTARSAFNNALLVYEREPNASMRTLLIFPASESLSQKELEAKEAFGRCRNGEPLPWKQNACSVSNQLDKWFEVEQFFTNRVGAESIALSQSDGKTLHAVVLEVPQQYKEAFEMARKEHALFPPERTFQTDASVDTLTLLQERHTEQSVQARG